MKNIARKANWTKQSTHWRGLFRGIAADNIITKEEELAFRGWIMEQQSFEHLHPFNEVIPGLESIFSNKRNEDIVQDILWLCDQISDFHIYFDGDTVDMQTLQGKVNGILADNIIELKELQCLLAWVLHHPKIQGIWPCDEIEAFATEVLEDGVIDENEHEMLLRFFDDFQRYINNESGNIIAENMTIQGVCAIGTEIVFTNRCYCVTGISNNASRTEFEQKIIVHGGKVSSTVVIDLDCFIIGAGGSSCWTCSCYRRKIEKAMHMRREGARVAIVHEYDFWDAVEQHASG